MKHNLQLAFLSTTVSMIVARVGEFTVNGRGVEEIPDGSHAGFVCGLVGL